LLGLCTSPPLRACFCAGIEPVCNDAKPIKDRYQALFIGTAIEVTERPRARAVFNVREWFNGPLDHRVEVGLGDGDCRAGFTVGVTYLVEAFRDGHDQWSTDLCRRNSPVDDVSEDIEELRALRRGESLGRRVYGVVNNVSHSPDALKPMSGKRVLLARQDSTKEVRSDATGRFLFADLAPGVYRLSVDALDLGGADVMIDLERGGCYRALITLDRKFGSYSISGRGASGEYTHPTPSRPQTTR
jgi:hypothetical protein